MAITPEEAGRVSQDESKTIQETVRIVDELLRSRYQGTGTVEICGPLERLSERCLRQVLSRYRSAGWDIKTKRYEADQRDPRERSYTAWVFSAGVRPSGPAWRD